MIILSNRQLVSEGFVPEVTWGLNLKLGDAPAKGSWYFLILTSIRPLFFYFQKRLDMKLGEAPAKGSWYSLILTSIRPPFLLDIPF